VAVESTTVAAGVGGAGRVELSFAVVDVRGGSGGGRGALRVSAVRRLAAGVLVALRHAAAAAAAADGGWEPPPGDLWAQTWHPAVDALLVAEAVWLAPGLGAGGVDAGAFGRYATPNLRGRAPDVPYVRVDAGAGVECLGGGTWDVGHMS